MTEIRHFVKECLNTPLESFQSLTAREPSEQWKKLLLRERQVENEVDEGNNLLETVGGDSVVEGFWVRDLIVDYPSQGTIETVL